MNAALRAILIAAACAGEAILNAFGRVQMPPQRVDDFDEAAAARYLEQDARDRGLADLPTGTLLDGLLNNAAPYSVPLNLQRGDLASVQLPDGQLITGVWDPTVEGSIDTDPERVAAVRAARDPQPVGTVRSGLIDVSHSPFAAASETSPGRDSAAEEGVPAPRDVPPARGAGQLQLPTVEDLRDGAYLLRRLAQRNNMRGTTDGFRCFEIADQLSALADDVEAEQQAHK